MSKHTLIHHKKRVFRGLYIFLLLSEVFLFLRVILRLFGANPDNLFAGFIYIVSGVFLLPFFGILTTSNDQIIAGQMAVDKSALVAMFCYFVLTILALCVVHLWSKIVRIQSQADETVKKSRPVDTTVVEESIE